MNFRFFKFSFSDLTASQRIQSKKTVSWTLISVTITFLVVWIVTGSWEWGAAASFTERIIKIILYYPHERYWHKKYKALKKVLKNEKK